MNLLTATTHTLELVTGSAASTDYHVEWADHDSSTFSPGSTDGNVAAGATTTILAAPAGSTQRQVKGIEVINRSTTLTCAVTIQKNVSGTVYIVFGPVTLNLGESVSFGPKGWRVLDIHDRLKRTEIVAARLSSLWTPPFQRIASLAGTKNLTAGVCIIRYVGKAPRGGLTSISVRYRVTTAGTTFTFGELALAVGTPVLGGAPEIMFVGFVDCSGAGQFGGLGQHTAVIPVSAGQVVNEGDDMWIVFNSNTTGVTAIVRSADVASDFLEGAQCNIQATVRPSTNIGNAVSCSYDTAGTTVHPWIALAA